MRHKVFAPTRRTTPLCDPAARPAARPAVRPRCV